MARSHRLPSHPARLAAAVATALSLALAACGEDEPAGADAEPVTTTTDAVVSTTEPEAEATTGDLFPDVLAATAEQAADGSWRFDVTLSSPYDTPERYADAWRVLDPDGNELGVRVLGHDHQFEQPFTRSLSGVTIPADVTVVTIEGRDQVGGWGGATVEVVLG